MDRVWTLSIFFSSSPLFGLRKQAFWAQFWICLHGIGQRIFYFIFTCFDWVTTVTTRIFQVRILNSCLWCTLCSSTIWWVLHLIAVRLSARRLVKVQVGKRRLCREKTKQHKWGKKKFGAYTASCAFWWVQLQIVVIAAINSLLQRRRVRSEQRGFCAVS
jgi:hypothetical protein